MGLMKTAAVRGLIPNGYKVTELRNNLFRLMTKTAKILEERFGSEGLDAVSAIFRELGSEDAAALKKRLELGDELKDALDAWIIVGHVMGAKMIPHWINDSRVETEHPFCPQHASFVEHGKIYCEHVCLPYVEALATGVAPSVKMEVVVPASMEKACTKALVIDSGDT